MNAPPGLRDRATTGVRWTFLASAATASAQLLQLVVLARILSPREFGLIGMLLIFVGFAYAYTDLGLSAALIHRRDDTSAERSSLYWLNVLAGIAVFLLALAAVPFFVTIFHEPRLAAYLRTVSLIFVIVAVGKQFEVLLEKELSFRELGTIESVSAIGGAGTTIVGAVIGYGVWAFVAGTLVIQGIKTASLLVLGVRRFRPSLRLRWSETRTYLAFGGYQVGQRTVNFFSDRFDQLLIGNTVGTLALGYYNLAFNITTQPISRINPVVTRVAFPALSAVQDDQHRLRRGYLEMVKMLTAVNAPLLLGLAAAAPTLIPTIVGSQWKASVVLVQLLCLASVARTVMNPVGSLLLARGRADLGFKWNCFIMVLTLPAVAIGAQVGGATGVATALVLLNGAQPAVAFWFLVRRVLDVKGRDYALAIIQPLTLAAAMAVVISLVPVVATGIPLGILSVVQVGLGAVLYSTALWRLQPRLFADLRNAVTRSGTLASPRRIP